MTPKIPYVLELYKIHSEILFLVLFGQFTKLSLGIS